MRKEGGLMLIGAAVGDVTVLPVPEPLPAATSTPMERIRLSTGGDALNEATVAARLGAPVALVTLLGRDDMADVIRAHCRREGLSLLAAEEPWTDTALNVVLVDGRGERRFLTNANGTLRRLGLEHILPLLETDEYATARAVCLASLFVSPALTLADTRTLFQRVKADGKLLCADTTRPKNGETLADAAPALQYLDWFFPNLEEALRLTGEKTPRTAAEALLTAGVQNAAIKLGDEGCLLASREPLGDFLNAAPSECGCPGAENPSASRGPLGNFPNAEPSECGCSVSGASLDGRSGMAPAFPNSGARPCFQLVPAASGVSCVDTTGAGDTFAAAFQCALLAGEPPIRCAAYANAAASLCVEQPGATAARLDPDEIARRRDEILARL